MGGKHIENTISGVDNVIGGIVGLTQNIIGHPFDTLKVLVQSGKKITNIHLKPTNLYAGIGYPTMHLMITNSILFDSFKRIKTTYGVSNFNAALISGMLVSPITYLFECGKTRRQTEKFVNSNAANNRFLGNYFRKGFLMTASRESLGMAFYFSTYFYMKDDLNYNALVSGAAAGVMSWTTTYQLDVLKSRQMSLNISLKDALKMGNLWKGYSYCITRAIIVNGVSFYVYDVLQNHCTKLLYELFE